MDRRAFVGSVALGVLARPRAARAQPARRVYRIGILGLGQTSHLTGPRPLAPDIDAFVRGLGDLGYVYGTQFVTEPRGADGRPERYASLAAELLRLQLDVIVAAGPALPALKQATSTLPVVMAAAGDPVGLGLVQSLRQPGGNFTGLSLQSVELTGKRLELLKELVPGAGSVAVLWDRASLPYWQAAETAARERGWKLLSLEIREAGDLEHIFTAASDARVGAVLVSAAGLLYPRARRVAELAARSRLPTMYELRPYVEAGGLMSYGADIQDLWRRAAIFVDKILKGADPADLPIEQPSKFQLVVNLKTARALGITIPPSILLRADHVIR
jgi:putative ABC transport system substrate-binding protein